MSRILQFPIPKLRHKPRIAWLLYSILGEALSIMMRGHLRTTMKPYNDRTAEHRAQLMMKALVLTTRSFLTSPLSPGLERGTTWNPRNTEDKAGIPMVMAVGRQVDRQAQVRHPVRCSLHRLFSCRFWPFPNLSRARESRATLWLQCSTLIRIVFLMSIFWGEAVW